MTVRKALIGVDFARALRLKASLRWKCLCVEKQTHRKQAPDCRNMTDNDETLHN